MGKRIEFCDEVHQWFGLTYASYAVLPRVLMEHMPGKWQREFVRLMDQAETEFPEFHSPVYVVQIRDKRGQFIYDPLREYRHADPALIESFRRKRRA